MTNLLTSCKVRNQCNNNEELTVCAKWTESKVQFFIFKCDNTMLTGEVPLEGFTEHAHIFEKTLDVYINEMQDILSGNNEEIDFNLENNKFHWKKKKWLLGKVLVQSGSINDYVEFTSFLLNNFLTIKTQACEWKKENEDFKTTNVELIQQLHKAILTKEQLEVDLYKRFILLLNSKKEKNRELRNNSHDSEKNKNNIYDAATDSENEDTKICENTGTGIKPEKRKAENLNKCSNSKIETKCGTWFDGEKNYSAGKKIKLKDPNKLNTSNHNQDLKSSEKSTSTQKNRSLSIGEDEETPDLLSDESEFELKLEDDKNESGRENELVQQDSEEIMFN